MYISVATQRMAATPKSTGSGRQAGSHHRLVRALVLIGIMAVSFWLGSQLQVNAANEEPIGTDVRFSESHSYILYTVESGDTLWTIADRHLPAGKKLTDYVHEIRLFNGMDSSKLIAGQALRIPLFPLNR